MKRHEQFTVLGKPFLALGGQVHNSTSYALGSERGEKYQKDIEIAFKSLKAIGANTIEVPVCWDAFEPEEGVYNRGYVERIIERTREQGMHAILLWFGTWKNGTMEYTPSWVKSDRKRFPRVRLVDGREVAALSPHYEANKEQDKKAFCEMVRIVKEYDEQVGTVIAIQVENECGMMVASMRDFSEKGNEAFYGPVPEAVIEAARKDTDRVGDFWKKQGQREVGNWSEVFGYFGAELCNAWAIASYIDEIAAAGKSIYDIFMYTNAWTDKNTEKGFSMAGLDYPAGGPVSKVLPVWYAACPHLDALSPDMYDIEPDGIRMAHNYYEHRREGWPLFVPESEMAKVNATMMFEALGTHRGIGYSIFAAESYLDENGNLREDLEAVQHSYTMFANVADLLIKYRDTDRIYTLVQNIAQDSKRLEIGDWVCKVSYAGAGPDYAGWVAMDCRHNKDLVNVNHVPMSLHEEVARGFLFQVSDTEFYLVGHKVRLYWQKIDWMDGSIPGNMMNLMHQAYNMELLKIEEGHFENGEYIVDRIRSGDEARHGVWAQYDCGVVHFVLGEI